jgi:hypothetical protein
MDLQDKVPQVDPSGTNQLAFAAEHAFSHFFPQAIDFSAQQQCMHAPYAEIDEMSGRTCSRTTPAGHAANNGRLRPEQSVTDRLVIFVVVDLPILADFVTEGLHLTIYDLRFTIYDFKVLADFAD